MCTPLGKHFITHARSWEEPLHHHIRTLLPRHIFYTIHTQRRQTFSHILACAHSVSHWIQVRTLTNCFQFSSFTFRNRYLYLFNTHSVSQSRVLFHQRLTFSWCNGTDLNLGMALLYLFYRSFWVRVGYIVIVMCQWMSRCYSQYVIYRFIVTHPDLDPTCSCKVLG